LVVQEVQRELKRHAERGYRDGARRFFDPQPITLHGVRLPVVRRVSAKFWNNLVKKLAKDEVFELCEDLLRTDYAEERTVAFDWAFRVRARYDPGDFKRLESWLERFVENWAACDDLCRHALGDLVWRFPRTSSSVLKWTRSRNRWRRRAAAVVMIYPNARQRLLDEAFAVADRLLDDRDDMVMKGYGWMLKEISNRDPQRVFEFVMERRDRMGRTALRYAIEKLDPELRRRAMEREQ
jgi:3-methyladenine DNA glycosylase AlkD